MRNTAIALVTLVLAAGTSGAVAHGPTAGGYGTGAGMMMGQGMMGGNGGMGAGMMGGYGYGVIDIDQNGRISDSEAAAVAGQVFAAHDFNGDNVLSEDEYVTPGMGYGAGNGMGPGMMGGYGTGYGMGSGMMGGYGMQFGDSDAFVSHRTEQFGELDADGDGSVTRAEFFDAARARYQAADTNGDGVVDPWEYRRQDWY